MDELGDALGTAAAGGLLARTFSRRRGPDRTTPGHFQESACLNCGTALAGPHCHECGQAAHLHRTLGALGHDIAHGVFHLDGKTWRTLPMLAWKPGELTRRYVHGERANFVSPMALFLFSIFLMFAVFQAVGLTAPTEINTGDNVKAVVADQQAKTGAALKKAREKLAKAPANDPETADLKRRVAKLEDEFAGLSKVGTFSLDSASGIGGDARVTGIDLIDEGIVHKWQKNPGLMIYKLQSNSYKFSWLLIPLSLPFMWLLFFWRRNVKVYDHAIFVTYSIAFMSLLFVVASLLGYWDVSDGVIVPLVTLVPAIHLYRQLRGAYGLSRRGALWRLATLAVFILIVMLLFLQILLVMGAF